MVGAAGAAVARVQVLDQVSADRAQRVCPGVRDAVGVAGVSDDVAGRDAGGRHVGELYPKLIERVPEQAPMTEEVEHEHQLVKTALDAASAASAAWRQRPSAETGETLAATLDQLNAVAQRHLDDEEQNRPARRGDAHPAGVGRSGQAWGLPDPPQQESHSLRDDPRPARRGRPRLHNGRPAAPGADALPVADRAAVEEVRGQAAHRDLTWPTGGRARDDRGPAVTLPPGAHAQALYLD
jgi:hypothetical protein